MTPLLSVTFQEALSCYWNPVALMSVPELPRDYVIDLARKSVKFLVGTGRPARGASVQGTVLCVCRSPVGGVILHVGRILVFKRRTVALWLCLVVLTLPAVAVQAGATPEDSMNDLSNNPLVQQAIGDLASRESLLPAEIEVASYEEVVWPDTTLGCPHPDMRYRQVPQDGARIVLRARGALREYHSGGHRAPFLCTHTPGKGTAKLKDRNW